MPIGWYEFGFLGLVVASVFVWRHLAQAVLPTVLLLLVNYFVWIDLEVWWDDRMLSSQYGWPTFPESEQQLFTTFAVFIATLGTLIGFWNHFHASKAGASKHEKKEPPPRKEKA